MRDVPSGQQHQVYMPANSTRSLVSSSIDLHASSSSMHASKCQTHFQQVAASLNGVTAPMAEMADTRVRAGMPPRTNCHMQTSHAIAAKHMRQTANCNRKLAG